MQGTESTQNGVIRVRVSDLLFALQKRWMVIVALSLVGLTFGLILSAMTVVRSSYQSYNINGSFAITSKNTNGQYVGGYNAPNVNDFHLAEDMVDAVRYVLRSERVLNEVVNENELLGYTTAQIRNAITVTQYNSTQILEMRLTWRNAEEGLAVWRGVLRHASDILPETLQLGSLEIINEPTAELIGVVGGGNNKVVLLTLLGFAAGVGFAIVELLMHPTLNNVRDVETLFGLETIGVIPRDNAYYRRKDSIMTRSDVGNSLVVQNFSAAAYILRNRLGTRDGHQCFYVTSAIAGEGKTTVAANLAIQLSDMERKVLLIDFDTRNPNLGALFLNKVDYEHSLNALYRGDVTADEAITTLSGYLDILPSVLEHNAINVDNMLIELVEDLKKRYEYVIMDAPPVGVVSGTRSLNQVADSVLFVIGYDESSLPEIQSSLEKLDKSGTRVLGCVVNAVTSGRALSVNQTAEDYKKSISRKAAQKKAEEAKYGFDDSQTHSALPPESKDRKKKNEKKKKGLFGRKKEEAAEEPAQPAAEGPKRNVYEDTIKQEDAKAVRSDQEAINELVRMGLTNDFGEEKPDAQAAEPGADETVPAQTEAPSDAPVETVTPPPENTAERESAEVVYTAPGEARTVVRAAKPQQIVIVDAGDEADWDAPAEGVYEPVADTAPVKTAPARSERASAAPAAKKARKSGGTFSLGRLLLALPLAVILAAAALLIGCEAAAVFVYGASGAATALRSFTELADRLTAVGISFGSISLGLLLFWLALRMLVKMIPDLIRKIAIRPDTEEET